MGLGQPWSVFHEAKRDVQAAGESEFLVYHSLPGRMVCVCVCVCVCTHVLGKGARAPFSDLLQHLCFFASLELVALAAVTKKSPNLSCLP